VGSFAFTRRRMLGRLAIYLAYLGLVLVRGLVVRADLVIAMTDPPLVSVVGAILAGVRRRPLVFYIQDVHPDWALAAGLVRPGPLVSVWRAVNHWALRRADRVLVLGEDMRRRIIEKGVAREGVVVARIGAPVPADLPPRNHPVALEVRSGFPFVVLHAGNLGFGGAWATLLSAAQELNDDGAGFVFVGEGAAAEEFQVSAAAVSNVRVLPYRPAHEVPFVLQAGDLHVVTIRRGLEGLMVPSKLYPILAAGRPVLAVTSEESDVAAIVRDAGCGWVAAPDDPIAVATAVREAMRDREELEARGRRARALAPEFDRSRMLRHLVRVVEDVDIS